VQKRLDLKYVASFIANLVSLDHYNLEITKLDLAKYL